VHRQCVPVGTLHLNLNHNEVPALEPRGLWNENSIMHLDIRHFDLCFRWSLDDPQSSVGNANDQK
jgi:hypothetical protein